MANLTGKKIFGCGRFVGINNVTNPTPMRPLLVQDMSVTFKRATKSIFGENQFAADVSSGEATVNGKVSFGATNARLFADLLFGTTSTTVLTTEYDNEAGTLTLHAYTVLNPGTGITNYGVVNTTNGVRYARVAAASEVAGVSYSLNAATGVYTFNASETGTTFKFSYSSTAATGGETVSLTNTPMGKINDFTANYVFPWYTAGNVQEQDILTLNSCIASDHEISTKAGDYGKPTFSFEASCDANDNLGSFSFAETS